MKTKGEKGMRSQSNKNISKLYPETMSPLETKDTEVHTPQLTGTLVGMASEKEEQKNDLSDSDNSRFLEVDSDDTIDNIV